MIGVSSYKATVGGSEISEGIINAEPTKSVPLTTTQPILKHYARQDWSKIVELSIKFYHAQMSGKLPVTHPVRWRMSAHETDGRPCGADLSGGFYDCKMRYIMIYIRICI